MVAMRSCLVPLLLTLGTAGGAAFGGESGSAPAVALRKGVPIREALGALAGPVRVVAADVSAVDPKTRHDVSGSLEESLRQISLDYDRYCILRGTTTLALQRRFADPEEEPGLEMEELRLTTEEMYRLIRPFTPRLRAGPETNQAHDVFAASITGAQEARMRSGGLPYRELTPEQQGLWSDITAQVAYDETEREIRRLSLLMGSWRELSMEEFLSPGGRLTQTIYRFPDPAASQGRDAVQINIARADRRVPRVSQPEVETRPPVESQPDGLRTVWRLPLAQTDLASVAKRWAEAGGPPLQIPDYAKKRRLWIASNGTRGEVLGALADLWGWSVSRTRDGFRLGRPRLAPARDPFDLHRKLRAAVPPALVHMVGPPSQAGTDRPSVQMESVFAAAERVAGPDWKHVNVNRLDQESQDRLANQLVRSQIRKWWGTRSPADGPNPAFVSLERGVLALNGPLGPGLHPTLTFWALDAKGRRDGRWGFAVGTHQTIKQR